MTDRITERSGTSEFPITAAGGYPDEPNSGTGSEGQPNVADHAAEVGHDAKESGRNVASTAKSEAKDVAHEARTQLSQLFRQFTSEANDQASSQTQRAVSGLRSLGGELSGMASSNEGQSGMASDLARQGAERLDAAASWLEGRQPGELLDEVRSLARRRPGAFLAGAAVLGLVGGRLTRGLTADSSSGSGQTATDQGGSAASFADSGSAMGSGYAEPTGAGMGAAYAGTTGASYGDDASVGYGQTTGAGHGDTAGVGYGGTAGTAYGDTVGTADTTASAYGDTAEAGYGNEAGAAYSDDVAYTVPVVDADLAGDTGETDPATYRHPGSSTGAHEETR